MHRERAPFDQAYASSCVGRACHKVHWPYLVLTGAVVIGAGTLPAPARAEDRSFEIYGFAQVDWIQDTKRVNPDWMDAFRPSRIAARTNTRDIAAPRPSPVPRGHAARGLGSRWTTWLFPMRKPT